MIRRRTFLLGALSALAGGCLARQAPETMRQGQTPLPSPTLGATQSAPAPTAPPPTETVAPTPTAGPPPRSPDGIRLTPNDQFYTMVYNRAVDRPPIDPTTWTLTIAGEVEQPLTLDLDGVMGREAVEVMRTLQCISNPVGGNLIGNAIWRGIRFGDLLRETGLGAGVREVKLESYDGYSTSIPLDLALDPESLLVYGMNGEPLPHDHGFPVRLLLPGRYGQKQPKWLTRIELIREAHLGNWEQQGWSNEAHVRVNSQIEAPTSGDSYPLTPLTISGRAFAGDTAITVVEVSTDDGEQWQPAELVVPPTPLVWTEWHLRWEPPAPGRFLIRARATDASGDRQSRDAERLLGGTFPDGTSDIHGIGIRIE